MPTVKFHEPGEFKDELKLMQGRIEGNILRLTYGHKSEYPSTVVLVIATALVGNMVLRLESRCGSFLMSESSEAEQVRLKAKSIRDAIESVASELKLEVRAGMYEA